MEGSSLMDRIKEMFKGKESGSSKSNWKKALVALSLLLFVGLASFYIYQDGFSYMVKMDGQELAYVKEAETVDLVIDQVKADLKDQYGEKAYFDHEFETEKVRDHNDDLVGQEELVETISQKLKVLTTAYIIKVDGIEMAILESEEEANLLLEEILEPYRKEDQEKDFEVISVSFKQDVQVSEKNVAVEKLQSAEQASQILNELSEEYEEYELKENENTWTVSRSLNVREADILAANPDVEPTRTRAGDKLRIPSKKAILEVASVERHILKEDIDFETEEKKDSSLYKGDKKVKQEGKKGKKKSTTDITYLNGIESERNVIEEEIIEEPVKKIVLVGTKEKPVASNSGSYSGPAVTYNRGTGSGIVATAKSLLGVRYTHGGSTPSSGFDCSGFTSYVYRQHGISLPRTAGAQSGTGKLVPKSQLQPGDLVTFKSGSGTTTGHAGIYVGGGQMIHAPGPGKGVRYASINNSYFISRFVAGRRPY